MISQKFKVSYDEEGDVLTIYREDASVSESVEVTEELVIDLDKDRRIANVELLDAYKFLHTLNENINKKMLSSLQEAELQFTNYRNYWIISLVFEYGDQKIVEKLPAFAQADFQSPLVASASA
tara:strand:+ start:381 stop:749 length:369 start_codon:yes stop_codon:yes gene_type:complete